MIRHRFENGMHIREVARPEPEGMILYVHGLGESGLNFEGLMTDPRLGKWAHLAPDIPGYGKSPWPEKPLTIEEQAELFGNCLTDMGSERVVVLGHSMGGVSGLILCERFPGLVEGFINVEGNISSEDTSVSSIIALQSEEVFTATGFSELLDSFYTMGIDDEPLKGYYASARLCDPRTYYRNSLELVEVSRKEELAGRLSALECPLIYFLGDPRGTGQLSRSLLDAAGVEWVAIPEAGHWPFIDQHELFVDEVVKFLSRLGEE